MRSKTQAIRPARRRAGEATAPPTPESVESLAAIHRRAQRERLLDMERRLRPYRLATFAILALAMVSAAWDIGWWWIAPLGIGTAGFVIADRFMQDSERPQLWVAGAWGALPLLLAIAIVATGGPTSPAVAWLALPTVTLGNRFESRAVAVGAVYVVALFFIATVAYDPGGAVDNRTVLTADLALILGAVILSGAMAESERSHRRRATLDPLTGLLNRNALEQRLDELEGQPSNEAEGLSHALLLCDLDHFKRVNDQLGHAAGDAVLQDVAYVMRALLRAGDSIYRVGGEEILVILPGAGREEASEIAERLRLAVRERRPVGVTVTVSVGVAVSRQGRVETDDLIARADAALYAAKEGGRDAVVLDGDVASAAEVEIGA